MASLTFPVNAWGLSAAEDPETQHIKLANINPQPHQADFMPFLQWVNFLHYDDF